MQNSNTQTNSCLDDYIFPFFVLAPIFLGIAIYVYFLFFHFAEYCFSFFNNILINDSSWLMSLVLVCGLITTNVITSKITEDSSKVKISILSFGAMISSILTLILFIKITLNTGFLYNIYDYFYNQINLSGAATQSALPFLKLNQQYFHILFSGLIGSTILVILIAFFFWLSYFLIIDSKKNKDELTIIPFS